MQPPPRGVEVFHLQRSRYGFSLMAPSDPIRGTNSGIYRIGNRLDGKVITPLVVHATHLIHCNPLPQQFTELATCGFFIEDT